MDSPNHQYLGDAVYISNDGYQLWLHLNNHQSAPLIALDVSVFENLKKYGDEFFKREGQRS
jgi:hypothetical protein